MNLDYKKWCDIWCGDRYRSNSKIRTLCSNAQPNGCAFKILSPTDLE